MTATHDQALTGATAAYLRCYPYDSWNMAPHRRALEEHAQRLGLRVPQLYLDNGTSSSASRPQLRLLLAHVSMGLVDTVLVPGHWVFSLNPATSHAVVAFLRAAGARVVDLPKPSSAPGASRLAG
ncbi:recombinase family protein [Kitasatospora sp. NPDC058965]|uniref:recombinase family protein n=1 Tax=Kitasatospora sp. NPDC058965 TaxID=3346682 RepID=UPI0036C380B7